MTEAAEKKIKIFNLAKELNLASGTIIEFLTKKGYKLKGPMSVVESDMMKDIMSHFKKDKDVAERHQRKIAEIKETKRKTAEKKKEAEEEAKEPASRKKGVEEVQTPSAPKIEEAPSEQEPARAASGEEKRIAETRVEAIAWVPAQAKAKAD